MFPNKKWGNILRRLKMLENVKRIQNEQSELLTVISAHSQNNQRKRSILRQNLREIINLILIAQTKLSTWKSDPLNSNHSIDFLDRLKRIVLSSGLVNISDTLEHLGIPFILGEFEYLDLISTPILCSFENIKSPHKSPWVESIPCLNDSSLDLYFGLFLNIPMKDQKKYLRIKLHLNWDPTNVVYNYNISKILKIKDLSLKRGCSEGFFDTIIQLIHRNKIVCQNSNDLVEYIMSLYKFRRQISTIPVSKVIQNFVTFNTKQQLDTLIVLIGYHDHIFDEEKDTYGHLVNVLQDIITTENKVHDRDTIDLFDLMPWRVQTSIRLIRNESTIKMYSIENVEAEISLEQKIMMMPLPNSIKQKALSKYNESKGRQNDSSQKALNWVNEFIKIPFGFFRTEPCIVDREETVNKILSLGLKINKKINLENFNLNDIQNTLDEMDDILIRCPTGYVMSAQKIETLLQNISVRNLLKLCSMFNIGVKVNNKKITKADLQSIFIENASSIHFQDLIQAFESIDVSFDNSLLYIDKTLTELDSHSKRIQAFMKSSQHTLDSCIYAQNDAKRQVLRILGQWTTGNDTGQCLGFEGPPGTGKTTLAFEGISKILKDSEDKPRPFKMIALGGSTNGSSLVGHNYTYLGSSYGDIVRILIDSECMNPIIYIDELDKVSQTDQGREIIGILTHLTDPTQNTHFEDRYFAGIPLNLSRVLFIFSQNDPSKIDPILLDRIHRISFKSLNPTNKLEIAKKQLIPKIEKQLGILKDSIKITDEILQYIIYEYARESGVRKLKEQLYDIFREINLQKINNVFSTIEVTETFLEEFVFKNQSKQSSSKFDLTSSSSRVYGMFASKIGIGGVLPIQFSREQSNDDYSVSITGSLGDVMKESIKVAKTLAFSKIGKDELEKWTISGSKYNGIHVHFPEGATPKDGPSAGGAITIGLYCFITGRKFPGNVAMTGEIDLEGNIKQIGGIDEKFIGAYFENINTVIAPFENSKDIRNFQEYNENISKEINIYKIKHFDDLLNQVEQIKEK